MSVCSFDWPLLFQGMKVVLDPLAVSSWPIAGAAVAYWFRPDLQRLVSRLRAIRGAGIEADLSAESQQSLVLEAPRPDAATVPALSPDFPPVDVVYSEMDAETLAVLDQYIGQDSAKRFAWAVRMRSISETNRRHELNYRMIFGSQIQALKRLNYTGSASIEEIRSIYNSVVDDPLYAHFHHGRSFEVWLQFLVNAGYIVVAGSLPTDSVSITPLGLNFLFWMVEFKAVENRVG